VDWVEKLSCYKKEWQGKNVCALCDVLINTEGSQSSQRAPLSTRMLSSQALGSQNDRQGWLFEYQAQSLLLSQPCGLGGLVGQLCPTLVPSICPFLHQSIASHLFLTHIAVFELLLPDPQHP